MFNHGQPAVTTWKRNKSILVNFQTGKKLVNYGQLNLGAGNLNAHLLIQKTWDSLWITSVKHLVKEIN